MGDKSAIEWTNATWNPTTGCTKVSPGCAHCYAEVLTKRYSGAPGWPAEFKPWTPANEAENVVLHPERLTKPLSWKTPRRVFVNSMSDLFHEQIPDEFIDRIFAVMALTPQHTYQVLTKRPERMREYLSANSDALADRWHAANKAMESGVVDGWDGPNDRTIWDPPLPNVWLGVTVENQRWADERIPLLLGTPAAVRFISAEPLLGPLRLDAIECGWPQDESASALIDCLSGELRYVNEFLPQESKWAGKRLDWVIIGGESGPKHRPFDPDWARSIVSQCRDAGVAAFVKQLGGARPGNALEDLPIDLQVREFPR